MTHRPERFVVYNELPDGSGFTVKGSDFVFKYDSRHGWYDEQGNYYDRDGQPASQPSLSSSHSRSEGGGDYDDFDKQYRLVDSGHDYDHYDDDQLRNLQKIDSNLTLLASYTGNRPLRVYYSNIEFTLYEDRIEELYKGLVVAVVADLDDLRRRTGAGYFVLENKEKAKKVVEMEGKAMVKRPVYYRVESIEELLSDPIPEKYLKGIKTSKPVEVQKPKPAATQKSPQKELDKKPVEQPKPEPKPQPKSQPKPTPSAPGWKTFKFNLPAFKNPPQFKAFMQQYGLAFEKDYKAMKRITDKDGTIFGTVEILGDVGKVNGQKHNGTVVQFTSDI